MSELESVVWSRLRSAQGAATEIPLHLQALSSDVGSEREEAREKLEDTVYASCGCCHGTLYPAANITIPFINDILADDEKPNKGAALDFLAFLTEFSSSHFEIEEENLEEEEAKAFKRLGVAFDLNAELGKHIDIYAGVLNDVERDNRLYASHLLACLTENKDAAIAALLKRLPIEKEDVVRANMLHAIGVLNLEQNRQLFEYSSRHEEGPLARCVAEACHAKCAKSQTPETVLDSLTERLLNSGTALRQSYEELPSVEDFLADLATPVAVASAPHAERILPWYLEQVSDVLYIPDDCAEGLLTTALRPGGSASDFQSLSEIQRTAVLVIAKKAWPEPKTTFVNLAIVLRNFGLPDSPEQMSKLLGQNVFGSWRQERNQTEDLSTPWWRFW
jgi:hypothetical protein